MHLTLVTSVVALAILAAAAPRHVEHGTSVAIPITKRHSWLLKADGSIDAIALDAHITSVEAKIRNGLANFERNTGQMHPAAVKGARKRDYVSGEPEPLGDIASELWFGTILIGTPPQPLTVAFVTSFRQVFVVNDLIVPGSKCDSTCDSHTLWDPTASSSSHDLGKAFSLKDGDGSSTSGEQYTDTVTIAGFCAVDQTLGAAEMYSTGFQGPSTTPDGIMGMGYQSISNFNASPVMQTIFAEGPVDPEFSFKLTASGGELFIGGANSEQYTGDFTYVPVSQQGYWQVYMDYIESSNATQPLATNVDCVIDTGTTAIVGISQDVVNLYDILGGMAAPSLGAGFYTFKCDSFPNISFVFGNTAFMIPASTLNLGPLPSGSFDCLSGIFASQDPNARFWIIGDVFLSGVYSTFDLANNRVGFAQLA